MEQTIEQSYIDRIDSIQKMIKLHDIDTDLYTDDGDNLCEYGLCFDHCTDTREHYYYWQLCCGGVGAGGFKFYASDDETLYKIEYRFLEGASHEFKTITLDETHPDFLTLERVFKVFYRPRGEE